MIISVATGTGLQKAIQNKLVGFTGHIQITKFDLNTSYQNAPISTEQGFYPAAPFEDVLHIQKYATKAGIIKGKDDFEGVVLKGISNDYDLSYIKQHMQKGVIPYFSGNTKSDSIIISKEIANLLNIKVTDTAQMFFMRPAPKPPRIRNFVVSGIYETGLADIDKTFVIGDFNQVRKLNRWEENEAGGFELILGSMKDLNQKTSDIRAAIPFDLTAESVRQRHEKVFQWIELFDLNIYLIITIMVVVAIIQMVMSLLIVILEKTRFIGILKTLGSSNRSVRNIFLRQSAYSIGKGLLLGNILGLGFCYIQQLTGFIKLDQTTYYVQEVPIDINWIYIVALNTGTFLFCMLALIIPSLLISRINPINALRFD